MIVGNDGHCSDPNIDVDHRHLETTALDPTSRPRHVFAAVICLIRGMPGCDFSTQRGVVFDAVVGAVLKLVVAVGCDELGTV